MHGMPEIDKFLLIIKQENLVSHHVEWCFYEILSKTKRKKKFMAIKHTEHIHTLLLQLWNTCNFQRKHENLGIQLPPSLNNFQVFCMFLNP